MKRTEEGERQLRAVGSRFKTRADGNERIIEGYFAVFDSVYQIDDTMSESIAKGAFTDSIAGDIRALIDHNTMYVLGRTKAGTLQLTENSHGLYGKIIINSEDRSAMNLYERVKRGDVSQCSIGFDILEETPEEKAGGRIHWTIKKILLYEVSVCTFPAYEETNVEARRKQYDEIRHKTADRIREQHTEEWRAEMKPKLKAVHNR